jgi:hypothetical protein
MTPNQTVVNNVYLSLLGRPADPTGLGYYSGQLNQGVSRDQVVQQIMAGDEYHTLVVEQLYQTYLHRSADGNGLSAYVAFLNHGGSIEQLRAILLSSDEYYAARGGNSNEGFLTALYYDVLGRTIDPSGLSTYGHMLLNGLSRGDVALALLQSVEGSQYRVERDYEWLLHRGADASGMAAYAPMLAQTGQEETLITFLLSSDEFYAHS